MSANLIIAHLNEALDLMKTFEPWQIARMKVLDASATLEIIKGRWAAVLEVDEDTKLVDAEEVPVDVWDPAGELADEFQVMYGDRDEELDGVDYNEFVAIVYRMPFPEVCEYARWMDKAENAEQRYFVLENIIEKWGSKDESNV